MCFALTNSDFVIISILTFVFIVGRSLAVHFFVYRWSNKRGIAAFSEVSTKVDTAQMVILLS